MEIRLAELRESSSWLGFCHVINKTEHKMLWKGEYFGNLTETLQTGRF